MHEVHSETYKGHAITVELDIDSAHCDPRKTNDNLGTMVCLHGRYDLGDEHSCSTPEEVDELRGQSVALPLYLYDHSGITMSTTPFHCPWDSGQVGYIFVSDEDIKKEYGEVTEATKEKARETLRAEVKEYDHYISGDVFILSVDGDPTHGYVMGSDDVLAIAKEEIDAEEKDQAHQG